MPCVNEQQSKCPRRNGARIEAETDDQGVSYSVDWLVVLSGRLFAEHSRGGRDIARSRIMISRFVRCLGTLFSVAVRVSY